MVYSRSLSNLNLMMEVKNQKRDSKRIYEFYLCYLINDILVFYIKNPNSELEKGYNFLAFWKTTFQIEKAILKNHLPNNLNNCLTLPNSKNHLRKLFLNKKPFEKTLPNARS